MDLFREALVDFIEEAKTSEVSDRMIVVIGETYNIDVAENSVCQFRDLGAGLYGVTLLGFVNGILSSLTGQYLFRVENDEAGAVTWHIGDESEVAWKDDGK